MVIVDTVSKQVYEIIKTTVLTGQLAQGARIDPKQIAEENNVSLMPVRSALQQLVATGLVNVVPRVGFFVRRFSNIELMQINDTRKMFELYCLQNFFSQLNKTETKRILHHLDNVSFDDSKKVHALDVRLHTMFVEASHNDFLLTQYENFSDLFSLSMGLFSTEKPEIAKVEHVAILNAICEGNREEACACLLQHLDRVGAELVEKNSLMDEQ